MIIKLMTADRCTRKYFPNETHWPAGEPVTVPEWYGQLCSFGVLHCYERDNPDVVKFQARLCDFTHRNYLYDGIAVRAVGSGRVVRGIDKVGYETLTCYEQVEIPTLTYLQLNNAARELTRQVATIVEQWLSEHDLELHSRWIAEVRPWLDGKTTPTSAVVLAAEAAKSAVYYSAYCTPAVSSAIYAISCAVSYALSSTADSTSAVPSTAYTCDASYVPATAYTAVAYVSVAAAAADAAAAAAAGSTIDWQLVYDATMKES
jgi:hypothetical protein